MGQNVTNYAGRMKPRGQLNTLRKFLEYDKDIIHQQFKSENLRFQFNIYLCV